MQLLLRLRPAEQTSGVSIVEAVGEIDLATAPHLRERLFEVVEGPATEVIVDLSGVTFCDCIGLGTFIAARRRAYELGKGLRLVAVPPMTARMLHLTGLDATLSDRPSPVPDLTTTELL